MKKTLHEIKNGESFKLGKFEFFKLSERNGRASVVLKTPLYNSIFGESNNFKTSEILKALESDFIPELAEIIGAENITEFKTDLLALDGTTYGNIRTKISLPTLDIYRKNKKIFDANSYNVWWWLATADSTTTSYTLCVSPHGNVDRDRSNWRNRAVRPFCIVKSSIFVS